MFGRTAAAFAKSGQAKRYEKVLRAVKAAKENKMRAPIEKVDAAIAASHFRSLEAFKRQARAIDAVGAGRTRALRLLLKVLLRDARTPLNERVTYPSVRLVDHRGGHLTTGTLTRDDCLQEARDKGCDLVEVGRVPEERASVCLLTPYRSLVLADIVALLFKEQQRAENEYSRRRRIIPLPTTAEEAELHQKAAKVASFLTARQRVQLQVIDIPAAWRVPIHDSGPPVTEDAVVTPHPVARTPQAPSALPGPASERKYAAMETLEGTLRQLVGRELADHPRNPEGLPMTAQPLIRTRFMGRPQLLAEYSLAVEPKKAVKVRKRRPARPTVAAPR
eukprot:TRINITY_DN6034_c0_g1_i1.p1 TRINITY_DN6034_c0_g1~~TRINITY_DN6034_c0_g1_i1.p1  ORF type:complete len:334 (+),score=101.88 TRINITY_DN6034_c0_g1_i1:108-1109(+)